MNKQDDIQLNAAQDTFCFLKYIHDEKLLHKEQRHKHVLHKLFISGAILGIGQLIQAPNFVFFVILFVPLICLVHDIYIFAEHFKVKRIGCFLKNHAGLSNNELIWRWEKYTEENRERFALWGSLTYTVIIAILAAASPWLLQVKMTELHQLIYGLLMGVTVISVILVFVVATILNDKIR